MSDSKVYMIPDGVSGGSNNSIDPNLLFATMMNGGGNGFGGNNFLWVIFLFFLFPLIRNGFGAWGGNGNSSTNGGCDGLGPLANFINNNDGREMLLSAINRNESAVNSLAQMFNTSTANIMQAICGVTSSVDKLGGQLGLSTQQTINAIQSGNASIASQLASCCCDIKGAVKDVAIGQERGFASVAYETQRQTCDITKAIADSTQQILAGQKAAEMRELQRELSERDRMLAEKNVIINNAQQTQTFGVMIGQATAPLAAGLNKLQSDIDSVKCKLPDTVTTPYQPFVAVPNCVAAQYGLGGLGYGAFWL